MGDENTNLSLQFIRVSGDISDLLVELERLEQLSKGRVLHTKVCVAHELVKSASNKIKELDV